MSIGLLLLAAALVLVGHNLWDENRAGRAASAVVEQLSGEMARPPEEGVPTYKLHPEMDMPTTEVDGRWYVGRVSIPSLGLELPVLSAWSSANGKVAPCRYQGSAYTEDMIIAGHNYRSHFGALKYIEIGAEVLFVDADGNAFSYTVASLEVLDGTAVEEMESGEWALTLFTCTYGGQARVTVRCV